MIEAKDLQPPGDAGRVDPLVGRRHVVCDVCGKENIGRLKRTKCLDCDKMMCRFCTAVLQGDGERCPDCRERRLLEFVEENGHRTRRDQIAVSVQGHRIYGVPSIGPNV